MLKAKNIENHHFEILENMADLIRIKNMENEVIYTNDDTLKGFDLHQIESGEQIPKTLNFDSVDGNLQRTAKIQGKDYSIKSSPIYNEDSNMIGSIEVFRDITREKVLETELTNRNKEIENDLIFAKKIQQRILPAKGDYGNLNIDYRYEPSKYLSGDLFDIFKLDDEHIGIYIVDVSGHGIAASMLTVFIRQTMYGISSSSNSPSEIFHLLQEKYQELRLESDRYFTMFYGIYNRNTREFKYANAGHNSIPFLFNDDSITMLVNYGLPILGFDTPNTYKDKSVWLNEGDSVFLYTDGLIEAKNDSGEEFGEDRVKLAILNNEGDLLEEIEEKLTKFGNIDQLDDVAMVLMTVN